MKRRASQERDDADARARADARREQLLAQLRDRETSNRETSVPLAPDVAPLEPGSAAEADEAEAHAEPEAEPAAEPEAEPEAHAEPEADSADPADSAEEVAG